MRRGLLAFLCLFLFSCTGSQERQERVRRWMAPNGKIKVLSTIAMIDDLVEGVGKEHVEGMVLIEGELDPHSYQLVKGDGELLQRADLIFFNGLNLEHGPSLKKVLYESKKAHALGDAVAEENPGLILHYNGQTDPHIWMDVSIWSMIVPHIASVLSEADPEHREEYSKNAEELQQQLLQLNEKIYGMLQAIPEEKRYLVTSHDAFNYFARSYLATDRERTEGNWQKRFAAPEGLSPDSQLSVIDIRNIVEHLEKYKIQVLFPESNLSRDSIRKIVEAGKERGLDLTIATCPLYADAMGSPGSPEGHYEGMVLYNARTIGLFLRDFNPRKAIDCHEEARIISASPDGQL